MAINKSPNKLIIKLLLFFKKTDGVAAIEFAIVFPVFALFFIFILQYGIMMFGNSIIKSVVQQAAHYSKIGCQGPNFSSSTTCSGIAGAGGSTYTKQSMLDSIRDQSLGLVDVTSTNFKFTVVPVTGYTGTETQAVSLGQGGDARVFIASYQWPVIFDFLRQSGLFGSVVQFRTVSLVRNEPFGTITNREF